MAEEGTLFKVAKVLLDVGNDCADGLGIQAPLPNASLALITLYIFI